MNADRGLDNQLPVLGPEKYLVDTLSSIGYTITDTMGERPIDWKDVYYYQSSLDLKFDKWEIETLISMSTDFMLAQKEGVNPLCVPPVERVNADSSSPIGPVRGHDGEETDEVDARDPDGNDEPSAGATA